MIVMAPCYGVVFQFVIFVISIKLNIIIPLIIIMKIENLVMSSRVRPSFKINLLKSDDIKLRRALKNNNPNAINTPFPIGSPSDLPCKNGMKSIKKRRFQITTAPIVTDFLTGNPPFFCLFRISTIESVFSSC